VTQRHGDATSVPGERIRRVERRQNLEATHSEKLRQAYGNYGARARASATSVAMK
jgi:hypothetical protein